MYTGKERGVTLVEMVIFIAIVGIALTGVMVAYLYSTQHSADAMIRIRTIELGQSFLEEILLRNYDENTPRGGGCVTFPANSRCPSGNSAQSQTVFGTDGEASRPLYDDVDDYHNLAYVGTGGSADTSCTLAALSLVNAAGTNIAADYGGYGVCLRVVFAGGELNNVNPGTGISVLANDAKRIDVIVTDPLGSRMVFSAYKVNF